MKSILSVKNLVKKYGKLIAVNDISFDVLEGQCFGLLGPNGAGKSTTLEILEDVRQATSGLVLFQGVPRDKTFKNQIGIQFQSTALQDHMSVYEALKLFSSFYDKTLNLDKVIDLCQLTPFLYQDHKRVSGGQRQRLLLALALVNDPKIIFLDEPTTGLDPHARIVFWDLINNVKMSGKTIVLTTHYMEEAHSLCDNLIIVDYGKIIAQGAPSELLDAHFKGRTLMLPLKYEEEVKKLNLEYQNIKGKCQIPSENISSDLKKLESQKVSINEIEIRSQNLEDLFIKLTGHQL